MHLTFLLLNLHSQQQALIGRPLVGVEEPPDCMWGLLWLNLQSHQYVQGAGARQVSAAVSGDQQYNRGRLPRPVGEQGQGSQHVPRPPHHNQQPGKLGLHLNPNPKKL